MRNFPRNLPKGKMQRGNTEAHSVQQTTENTERGLIVEVPFARVVDLERHYATIRRGLPARRFAAISLAAFTAPSVTTKELRKSDSQPLQMCISPTPGSRSLSSKKEHQKAPNHR